ncbi:MAG: hypothetical protein RCG15_03400 [Candidatus Rickettsia vulgarisii]
MVKIWQEKSKIIKIIESEGPYDYEDIGQLINEVMVSTNQPVLPSCLMMIY